MKRLSIRRTDHLMLEEFPLHTERPDWAAKAPEQVRSSCKRGAHVIGLTESRMGLAPMQEARRVAEGYGYTWFNSVSDGSRQVALLLKNWLEVLGQSDVVVGGDHRVGVTFRFHKSVVTVYQMHWTKANHENGLSQTHSLIEAMTASSAGKRLSFYMGDSNPTDPQRMMGSQPGQLLKQSGMPTVWQELNQFPAHLGVNMIGRNLADTRVKAVSADLYPPLGSDHYPALARYAIKRPLFG